MQILLLEGEGVEFTDGRVNLEKHLWQPTELDVDKLNNL